MTKKKKTGKEEPRTWRLNSSPHSVHIRFSSFSWSMMWAFRLAILENFFPHSGHVGSPSAGTWVATWSFRLSTTLKDMAQWGHLKGLSSSWAFMWRWYWGHLGKTFSQVSHLKGPKNTKKIAENIIVLPSKVSNAIIYNWLHTPS